MIFYDRDRKNVNGLIVATFSVSLSATGVSAQVGPSMSRVHCGRVCAASLSATAFPFTHTSAAVYVMQRGSWTGKVHLHSFLSSHLLQEYTLSWFRPAVLLRITVLGAGFHQYR